MEKNIFNDYLEGYVNVHNDMIDIDLSDKTQEIERLNKIIEANEMLVQNYMKVTDIDSNDKEKHKEFEEGTKQYMENIKNAEKEIEDINKKQEEFKKRKEQLEQTKINIRERAKTYKEERLEQEHKNKLDNELQNKIYEFNAKEYEINQKLEKFKDIELETTQEEVERIRLENELRKIQADKKSTQQQLNQETDISKKINKDYILFLGQLSLIDKNPEKIEIEKEEKETQKTKKIKDEKENSYEDDIELRPEDAENWKEESELNIEEINDNMPSKTDKVKSQIEDKDYKNIRLVPYKVDKIYIDESKGITYSTTRGGKVLEESIEEAFVNKKDIYKALKVKDICKEIAGGRIGGLLLGTKVNPAIIYSLRNDPETVKTYIDCLNNKTELPFELSHDLRNSNLGVINKLKMWVHAKAEDKIPGTKIEFAQHLWNKNKTLPSPEKNQETERNIREEMKIDNKDNRIEEKAAEKMKEVQEQMAEEVKETMSKGKEK